MTTYGVNLRLKWIWPTALMVLSLSPQKLGGLKFIPIYEALTIRAEKSAPPYIAFEETNLAHANEETEWQQIRSLPATALVAGGKAHAPTNLMVPQHRLVLNEMVIQKKPEIVYADVAAELSKTEKRRLQEAQLKSDVLDQDWNLPTWRQEAKQVLEQAGYQEKGQRLIAPSAAVAVTESPIYIAATDSKGVERTEIPRAEVDIRNRPLGPGKAISGPLLITGGLAVTNEQYIEVRRTNEGIAHEVGRVDLQSGTYNINVDEASGSLEAKLVDKEGKILGEGSVRLSRLDLNRPEISGPLLKIQPSGGYAGVASNFYRNRTDDSAPPHTVATLLKGAEEMKVGKDGHIAMKKIAKGSTTVLRAAAPGFMQTATLISADQDFSAPMFPVSMMKALTEIVTNQRQSINRDDGLGAIVWGKVMQDGKSLAGIQVRMEGDAAGEPPIYFNQFMLPDPKLTSTSENGLFAFVNVEEGFQSLIAMRGESLFGYKNVIAESGSVAVGDIENSIRIESVPLRVFDAFSGSPVAAKVSLQSIDHEFDVTNGTQIMMLPQVARMGLLRAVPDGNDYLPARYFYDDKDAYIHLPLVRWSWLSTLKSFLKIDDHPQTGVVVGFVPDEDFEVYLAGADNFERRNIVYFDMQGRILQIDHGIAGGGFILYNVPPDTQEIVTVGLKTQKVYSHVVPVDPNSLSVLSVHE